MQRTDSLDKSLILGNIEGRRQRGQQKIRWLDGVTNLMDMDTSNVRLQQSALVKQIVAYSYETLNQIQSCLENILKAS